jgi:1,4-alpha-glucan branching enzyme
MTPYEFATDTDHLAGDIDALKVARHRDPFAVLGPHQVDGEHIVRAFYPGAEGVEVVSTQTGEAIPLLHVRDGLFAGRVSAVLPQGGPGYQLRIRWPHAEQVTEDPYAFGVLLGDLDLHLIAEGRHSEISDCLGAHVVTHGGVQGVRFAVWAPNAQRVSVVGDFNSWDGRRHPMRLRFSAGVWEIFLPRLNAGARYKFEIVGVDGNLVPHKADPYARQAELAPGTASIVTDPTPFTWTDDAWMAERGARQTAQSPMSVYEVHVGSWLRDEHGESYSWSGLADRLVPYAKDMGFTHLELLPIMEHPFGGSWGYQPLGLFAPTARFGEPHEFARFVDRCHEAGIGVILDWVPAHFPTDAHGMQRFDGTALYEYQDPREGFHQDWNTLIYNLGRNEVRNFVIASGIEWLHRFHVDGLRVDAVASMLYRDYSRKHDEWIPNHLGGRENLEAIAFLRDLNKEVANRCPGAITIAEESTAWPGVTAPVDQGGLGFDFKWNMGWMHDTLHYVETDPLYRQYHHHMMTFGMVYAFSEKFVLPLSHDEVVHGKGSLIGKMPGDRWQKFANLRAYFGFMWSHPGKKLLFMGGELGQQKEWNHDTQLDWDSLSDPLPAGLQKLVRDLNHAHAKLPALHERDADPEGFRWLIGDDNANAVFAFLRSSGDAHVLAVSNMTPVPRGGYRIGVPHGGRWLEVVNSDAAVYGGSGVGNSGAVNAEDVPAHGMPCSVVLTLPPLSTLLLKPEG